jgi:hypothetical protein
LFSSAICNHILEFVSHTRNDWLPFVLLRLANDLGRIVPGSPFALAMPSPVAALRDHDQDRLAKRAGEMRNRGIDRHNHV